MREVMDRLNIALEGRYRIESEAGAGGMATVYLAQDLRHNRRVAMKVLKPELAAVVGAERFLAEIETTANLQHPHILPLFDSGEADHFLFYVMPFVEGETLREKLDRERQLPVEEAVSIARKVAAALQYAHEQGVVHRDIKPANVLLSRGEPLVADFGIALALSQAGGGRITETGLSVGTPHYMSPEQASGDQTVDRRTDVYALGCVLYEMLVGQPPHAGPSAQAVLARILTAEAPPVSEARPTVPPHVDAAVRQALQKLPADRFTSAGDMARALDDRAFTGPHSTRSAHGSTGAAHGSRVPGSVVVLSAAALVLAAAAFGVGRSMAPETVERHARFPLATPEDVVAVGVCCGPAQALSPDGEWLVFVGAAGGTSRLYRRRMGLLDFDVIPGTDGASIPFFSPDGRWVGFHAQGQLRKVPLLGGPAVPITEADRVDGASWGDNDMVVFASFEGPLRTVSASGGAVDTVPGTDGMGYLHPSMLPGGEAALVRVAEDDVLDTEARVVAVELETGTAHPVGSGTRGLFAAGHVILGTADGTLLARPFDPGRLEVEGPAVAILTGLARAGPGLAEFAVSARGDLVYLARTPGNDEVLVVRGPGGSETVPLTTPGNLEDPAFSPDGRRIALRVAPPGEDRRVWIWDRDQRTQQLLSTTVGDSYGPVWSPDGRRIAFNTERDGRTAIYWQPADGSGSAERLLEWDRDAIASRFSPDGDALLFVTWDGPADMQIGLLDLRDGTTRILVDDVGDARHPVLSPDGEWLAYTSVRSGRAEVYVERLDGTGGRVQISATGGHSPLWHPREPTLYYATAQGEPVVEVALTVRDGLRVLSRTESFSGPWDFNMSGTTNWDIGPGGDEFVYIGRGDSGPVNAFVWVLNWPGILEEMRGGG